MSRSRSREMDLTTGSPFWSLLKFAIPVILGNLFQLFYTLADSVIVGKTLGAESLAAVGSTSTAVIMPVSTICFVVSFDFFMNVSPPRRFLYPILSAFELLTLFQYRLIFHFCQSLF